MKPMPIDGERSTAKLRRVTDLLDGTELVRWLGAAQGTRSYARITCLISELQQLKEDYRSASRDFRRSTGEVTVNRGGGVVETLPADNESSLLTREKDRRVAELDERHAAVMTILERYSFSIGAVFILSRFDWASGLVTKHRAGDFVLQADHKRPYGEGDAAFTILLLLQSGNLDKLRRCPACNSWRYVAQGSYKFCSKECRLKHYNADPAFRRRQVEHQKAYRQRLKQIEASYA
jgi:hypothetical protein